MGAADSILSTAQASAALLPKIPSAPIEPIRQTLAHLLSTPVHPLYPAQDVLRFGVLHAVRVALAWEGIKRAAVAARRKRGEVVLGGDEDGIGGQAGRVGVLGDLLGYLVAAWGGAFLICLLLGLPPPWLTSSHPWLTYLPIYFILVPTGLSSLIISLIPPPLFTLLTSITDGLIRSTAIAGMPLLIASSPTIPGSGTIWTSTVLSSIAITGGGFIIDLFGLAGTGAGGGWSVGQPGLLKGGVLNTADAWSAAVAALAHAGMVGTYHVDLGKDGEGRGGMVKSSAGAMDALAVYARRAMLAILPSDLLYTPYGTAASSTPASASASASASALVAPDVARAVVALLLMSIYLAKNMTLAILAPASASTSSSSSSSTASKKNKKKRGGVAVKGIQLDEAEKEVLEAVTHDKAERVLQSISAGEGKGQASARESRAGTPRKTASNSKVA